MHRFINMAASTKLTTVKLRHLEEDETFASFTSWHRNLFYVLKKEPNYTPFLTSSWEKLKATNPNRGLADDPDNGPTKEVKVKNLNDMLHII